MVDDEEDMIRGLKTDKEVFALRFMNVDVGKEVRVSNAGVNPVDLLGNSAFFVGSQSALTKFDCPTRHDEIC